MNSADQLANPERLPTNAESAETAELPLTDTERALFEAFFALNPGDSLRDAGAVQAFLADDVNNVHVVEFLQWIRDRQPDVTIRSEKSPLLTRPQETP